MGGTYSRHDDKAERPRRKGTQACSGGRIRRAGPREKVLYAFGCTLWLSTPVTFIRAVVESEPLGRRSAEIYSRRVETIRSIEFSQSASHASEGERHSRLTRGASGGHM